MLLSTRSKAPPFQGGVGVVIPRKRFFAYLNVYKTTRSRETNFKQINILPANNHPQPLLEKEGSALVWISTYFAFENSSELSP